MELKRYLEKDSKTALEKIRSLHGDEALIVSTEKVGNKTEIIVGVEELKTADEKTSPKINDRPSTDLSNESADSRLRVEVVRRILGIRRSIKQRSFRLRSRLLRSHGLSNNQTSLTSSGLIKQLKKMVTT